MSHPAVAGVLDGGITPPEMGDRPYFVMEYVPGIPITTYCDEHKLSIRERLELFILVCEGVQHAHSKGIIHRDLTPRNILVIEHDNKPQPKIIDFGISKALGRPLTDKTFFTHEGHPLGVPEYMCPEQAQGLDIDTRADVYTLGVLLYELLTGAPPFDRTQLLSRGWEAMLRFIRDAERPHPSTRLSSLGDSLGEIARRRAAKPASLVDELARGLGWIPLRALEAERHRRYQTPGEFAADIRRYLNDDYDPPFGGRAWDSFRRFTRRNRRVLAGASVIVLALALWLAQSLHQLDQTRAAETDARNNATAARKAESEAHDAEARATQNAYDANIAAASIAVESGRIAAARDRLRLCAADLRGWEWERLNRESDRSTARARIETQLIHHAAFADDHRTVHILGYRAHADLAPPYDQCRDGWKFREMNQLAPDIYGTAIRRLAPGFTRTLFASGKETGVLALQFADPPPAAPVPVALATPLTDAWRAGAPMVRTDRTGDTIVIHGRAAGKPVFVVRTTDNRERRIDLDAPPELFQLSDDGRFLAATWTLAGGGCTCLLWDIATLTPRTLTAPSDSVGATVEALANQPDGVSVAVAGPAGAVVWRTHDGPPLRFRDLAGAEGAAMALSPDGRWLAHGERTKLQLRNLDTGDRATLRGHVHAINSLAFSGDNASLVSTAVNGGIHLWKVEADELMSSGGEIRAASASTDGGVIALLHERPGLGVRLLDTRRRAWLPPLAPGRTILHATMGADGRSLVLVEESAISVLALPDGRELHRLPRDAANHDPQHSAYMLPGLPARLLFSRPAPDPLKSELVLIDLVSGRQQMLRTFLDAFPPAFLHGSAGLFAAAIEKNLFVWPAADNLHDLPGALYGALPSTQIVLDSDGPSILGIGEHGGVWGARLPTGPIVTTPAHETSGDAIAALSGENRFATGGGDGGVVVWRFDRARGEFTSLMNEHAGAPVVGLAFDADTRTLWGALSDGRVRAMAVRP